jgi:pectate lyase
MGAVKNYMLLVLFALAMQTSTLKAGIANFDEYWKKRAEEAKEASREAYEPNPEKVTKHFNDEVHK